MATQQPPKESSQTEMLNKKQQLELRMLRDSLNKDKKAVDTFVEDTVPPALIAILKQQIQDLESQIRELQKRKAELTPQNRMELKNLEWLQKNLPNLQTVKYWQLLQILLQFPARLQIGIDKELAEYIAKFPAVQELKKRILIPKYVGLTLRQFLTDVITYWRLRTLQLQEISQLKLHESPLEKSLILEQEFAIIPHIPHHILVEKRMGGNNTIGIFKGMDLASNIPVTIKYLAQRPDEAITDGQGRAISLAEMRKRFEREAQAFDRLEKHRRTKEAEMSQIIDNAKTQIEEGKREGNYDKMKAGFELLKQGEELLCDRHFIKTYFLATGQLFRFSFTEEGFCRKLEGENVAFMAMEYLPDGKTLEEFLTEYRDKKSTISVSTCITILEGILHSLQYCHQESIIHRDIRPANILLTKDNKVRLTNLGLARVEDMTQLTAQGVFIGTPGYAAPEGIVQGSKFQKDFEHLVAATGKQFDLYSVGCVAYEILSGKPLFTSDKKNPAEHDEEILFKHLKEEPLPLSRIRPDVSARLNYVIMKLLAKKVDNRFANAAETLEALRASMSLGQKAGDFTNKVLDKIRSIPQGETVFPVPRKKWGLLTRMSLAAMLLAALAGVGGWYLVGNWWQMAFNKGKEWAAPYLQKAGLMSASQEQLALEKMMNVLELRRKHLQGLWQTADDLVQTLRKDYPPEEGFPATTSRTDAFLAKSRKDLIALDSLLSQAKNKAQQSGHLETLQWLTTQQDDPRYGTQIEALLNRVLNQLKTIEQIARQMKQAREEEEQVRRVVRTMRIYLFSIEEKSALIDEKLAFSQDRYPAEQGYPTVPPKVLDNFQTLRRQGQELSQVVTKITKAFAEDKLAIAKDLTRPYQKFSSDSVEQLNDIAESVSEVMKACERLANERMKKRTLDRAFLVLQDRQQLLQQYLPQAREDVEKLTQFFPAEKAPQELFQKAQHEMKDVQATLSQLSQYLQENKESQAVARAEELLKNRGTTAGEELQRYHEQSLDRIKIAQAAGKEQVYKKEIADLLGQAKSNQAALGSCYQNWQQEITALRQEFPKNQAAAADKSSKIATKIERTQQELAAMIESVEKKIGGAELQSAYQLLAKNKDKTTAVQKLSQQLGAECQRVREALVRARSDQQYQVDLSRCNRTVQKLEKYATLMTEQLRPLQKDVNLLKQEFPATLRYPQLNQASMDVLQKAQEAITYYEKEAEKGRQLINSKKISQALTQLQPFENKGLKYAEFPKDVQAVQEDIARVREECKKLKVHQSKIVKIEDYLKELGTRAQSLQTALDNLESNLNQLKPFARQVGYTKADPNVTKYQEEAKLELSQLHSLIAEGRQLLEQKRYQDSVGILEPYSETSNPGISRLPMIKAYVDLTGKTLQTNLQLSKNPAQLQEMVRRQEAEARRAAKLKQWSKSPGKWYDELVAIKKNYDQLQEGIERSLQDKGSSLVYARINSNWQKIFEYPQLMAELQELMELANSKKITLPTEASTFKEKLLIQFLQTRQISVAISQDIADLSQALQKIAKEIQGGAWVEEETLRALLRTLESVVRNFDEAYIPVKSELINLTNN